jgi:peptidoglycan hydrolase-like protein with peptidoglycan-binding domain
MKLRLAALVLLGAVALDARGDNLIQNVQQALKDEGYYYGEVTGTKDGDTTAAIRRYQIRNGLQITGEINDETLKSLGVDASGIHPVKPSPEPVAKSPEPATTPETSDLRDEHTENSTPTNPLTGQPFPQTQQDRQSSRREPGDMEAAPAQPGAHFAGTPYANSPPEVQREVIVSAQHALARHGLYRGAIDGVASPELEFSLRAYQARVRLPVSGRLDLDTLAALQLLPGAHAPVYRPRRGRSEEPVHGEWIRER